MKACLRFWQIAHLLIYRTKKRKPLSFLTLTWTYGIVDYVLNSTLMYDIFKYYKLL